MIEFITQPWSWWVSGIVISLVMFLLLYFGKSFGFSANLRTLCSFAGAGKAAKFFDFDWRAQIWNLVFLIGAIIGGFIASNFMSNGKPPVIAEQTVLDLSKLGFSAPDTIQPSELFSWDAALSLNGFLILAVGGLLVGFGARYAGGCTSGHAISGISNLQVPSMVAVVGFFIGGLAMTHLIFPLIF